MDVSSLLVGDNGIYFRNDDLASMWQDDAGITPVAASADPVGKIVSQSPSAILATQATAGNKPTYTELSGQKYLAVDGGDYLDSNLRAAAEMTMIGCFKASPGSQHWFAGCQDGSSGRCHCGIASDGTPGGAWGAQNAATIKGPSGNYFDMWVVVGMRANASVVELWCNGNLVYSGAPSGTATLIKDFYFGAANQNNVSLSSPLNGALASFLIVQSFIPHMRVPMRSIGRGFVSF